jgi:hypothetical protein
MSRKRKPATTSQQRQGTRNVQRPAKPAPPARPPLDPLAGLVAARAAREDFERAEAVAWIKARAAGHSWRVLGDAIGVSRSAAHQRYRSLVERFGLE